MGNPDKDKAIFDLANYSLEYCIMTNSGNTEFSLDNLKINFFILIQISYIEHWDLMDWN